MPCIECKPGSTGGSEWHLGKLRKSDTESDGPCHPPELRKRFWTDVLKSLELSYETLFEEARLQNVKAKEVASEGYIKDLEERIRQIQATLQTT